MTCACKGKRCFWSWSMCSSLARRWHPRAVRLSLRRKAPVHGRVPERERLLLATRGGLGSRQRVRPRSLVNASSAAEGSLCTLAKQMRVLGAVHLLLCGHVRAEVEAREAARPCPRPDMAMCTHAA